MFGDHSHNESHHTHESPIAPIDAPTTPGHHTHPKEHAPKKENFFLELFKIIVIAVLIVAPIRIYIAQPFVVSGASMDPTFHNGEYLIVDRLSYRLDEPQRGDVVIFRFPLEPSKFFIKRIIGLPGETVILQGKATIIQNDMHPSGFVINEPYITDENLKDNALSVTLSVGEYFVMGDNRRESSDSRSWGPVNEEYLSGKVFLRLFPITRVGVLPGTPES